MYKEIREQPGAVTCTLAYGLDGQIQSALAGELLGVNRVKLLGLGSAYHAGMTGAHLIEALARIPASAEPAAEFLYRNPVIEKSTLYVVISEPGENDDSRLAAREVRRYGGRVLGIVNGPDSSMADDVDDAIYTHAGPDAAVASIKAYTCSLVVLVLLALELGRSRNLPPEQGRRFIEALERLPSQMETALATEAHVRSVARRYAHARSAFYIGRGYGFPVALEGAQKLKQISRIHAEAYPASELKHGPLALVGPDIPTVVTLPHDTLVDKSMASIEEVRARNGPVIAVTHPGNYRVAERADAVIEIPRSEDVLNPIVMAVPLQLFAYHCALASERHAKCPHNPGEQATMQ